jgi:hypothetical protein
MGGNITILTEWSSNRLSRRARDETSAVRVKHVAAVGGQPSRWQLELLALENPVDGWVQRVSTRARFGTSYIPCEIYIKEVEI